MTHARLLRLKFRLWIANRLLDLAAWCGERVLKVAPDANHGEAIEGEGGAS